MFWRSPLGCLSDKIEIGGAYLVYVDFIHLS